MQWLSGLIYDVVSSLKEAYAPYVSLPPGPLKFNTRSITTKAIENNEGVLDYQNVLTVTTGNRTGRSPKDRFIIQDNLTQDTVHWGKNKPTF